MRTKRNYNWTWQAGRLPLTLVFMALTIIVWLNTWKQWQSLNKARNIVGIFESKYWEYSEENGRLKRELWSLKEPGSSEVLAKRGKNWRGPQDFNLIIPEEKAKGAIADKEDGWSKIGEWWRLFEAGGYGKMAR